MRHNLDPAVHAAMQDAMKPEGEHRTVIGQWCAYVPAGWCELVDDLPCQCQQAFRPVFEGEAA